MDIIKVIIILVISYLLGSVPFCFILAKITRKKDLRELGDNNPGGWNLVFNVSKWWGILGIVLDVLKGTFSYYLAYMFSQNLAIAVLAGCLSVAGHNYSVFLKFKGGKGVATTLGFLVILNPFSVLFYAISIVTVLFVLRNMMWGIISAIIFSCSFLIIFEKSIIYAYMAVILLILIIPKYINYSKSFTSNFKIDRGIPVKDLFTPKIR